ncbi:hypothetical protein PCYB_102370 [Plasmodium cynomolgi strain B]|uniref:Uncharacterized protein n=1 Tax=Plasmodium cynomolgi (strain B) TaxID=1120755 RepID=K6VCD8_PLACD|nr:hypothetical protein PCYB_102370 [Plasmodium cynomolgi strain B]GAB66887.1 hypothetical protein PCYB_102370 [Plasmodium cynomolgi strain B]
MTRHSKNNTANPIFTYHERKKVSDVGTLKERLGKDSMRRFEQCWICLRSAETPKEEQKNLLDISNNFWLARNVKVKDLSIKKVKRPSKSLSCPVSGKELKMGDLIAINPEVSQGDDVLGGKESWVCSYSKKNIDHQRAILIKKTGQIIIKVGERHVGERHVGEQHSIFEKFIYGKNTLEGTVGDGDFIELQPGGTAFCSHSNVEKTMYRESLL